MCKKIKGSLNFTEDPEECYLPFLHSSIPWFLNSLTLWFLNSLIPRFFNSFISQFLFNVFFKDFIKNPQTTIALTFFTHIISCIDGVSYLTYKKLH